ncbi:MMPL family transporter [Rathayibacter sp. YIM 133350]|uniref:MMPL family transporter n=1 Tax=Rathayibacter sp. YIM 133350 TaxID=3131992 RepID=UPI00307D7FDF
MATLLYRIGHLAYRRAWLVIAAWVVLIAGLLGAGFALGGKTQESYAIPGTESQQAIDKLAAVFPQTAGAAVQVVMHAADGDALDVGARKSAVQQMASELEDVDGVASVVDPFSQYAGDALSKDARTAYIQVQLDDASTDVSTKTLDAIQDVAKTGEDAGIDVAFGGQVFQNETFGLTLTEGLGVLFAAVVLFIAFGSLLAAGMPLLTALVGVGVAVGGITIVSAFASVSSTAPMLAVMLGLAVGIDYALFILSRHRTQLARGVSAEESAATSVATAGSAVIFAGLTVIIALLGLLVVGIPFLSVMGMAAAFAVLVAMLAAVTLLPAVMGVAKGRLAPKPGGRTARRALAQDDARPTLGRRWVNLVLKAPVVAVVLVVGILGGLSIPALSLDLNLPTGGSQPEASTTYQAYTMLSDGFGPGYNGPLIVEVDITQSTDPITALKGIADTLKGVDDVASVGPGIPNPTVDTAIIKVIPESAPDAPETKELVQSIRDLAPSIEKKYDTPIAVTGQTAVVIDISNRLTNALVPFALIVVGLSILLLMMVFRSVFVPVKAAVGFLLSVFAAIGVSVAIFQWGWFADLLHVEHPGPILSFLPILLMAVLFGLAMDYEVFLVSGMREEYVRHGDARGAIVHGFQHAARVVTAAALIMFFVFFAFVPEGSGAIKGIALALAVGVAFDAFLVRMTLVPAAMALAGRAAWWLPRWLARILPNVDIEGEGLRHHLDDVAWARSQTTAISADAASFGLPEDGIGPVDLRVGAGEVLVIRGESADRRVLAATLAGRLAPVGGRLQVLGSPLPSESSRVLGAVALVDVPAGEAASGGRTVEEVIAERVDFAQPWYHVGGTERQTNLWLDRLRSLPVADAADLTAEATLASLSSATRAGVLVAAGLSERPGVLVVELGEIAPGDEDVTLAVIAALLPAAVTLVVTGGRLPAPPTLAGRGVHTLDIASEAQIASERKGVLQ